MKKYISTLVLVLPVITFAGVDDNLMGLLSGFVGFANLVVVFFIGLATLVFLWGVVKYVIYGTDTTQRAEAKGYMVYGLGTLFVMVSVLALTYFISNTLGLDQSLDLPGASIGQEVVLLNNK